MQAMVNMQLFMREGKLLFHRQRLRMKATCLAEMSERVEAVTRFNVHRLSLHPGKAVNISG